MARFNTQSITTSVTGAGTVASPQAFTALNGTAPYTVTLPSPVLFPGSSQTFYNATAGTVTISTPSGLFGGLGASGAGTLAIPTNTVVSVTSDGVNYIVLSEDGSALVATTGSFTGNVTANGASATVSLTPQTVTIAPTGASTIDNINIGVSTRGSGAFNTLTANSAVTLTANTTSSSTGSGSLVVTGGVGVSGAVYAAGLYGPLTGTVQTAAQPNITSVGNLATTGLTVNTTAIVSSGTNNVGINTASPKTNGATFGTLTLNGSNGGAIQFTTNDVNIAQIYNDANALFINPSSGKTLSLQNNGTTAVSVGAASVTVTGTITNTTGATFATASGNVGIGTNSTLGKLHISTTNMFAAYKTYSGLGNTGAGDAVFEAYRLDGALLYKRVLDIVALGDSANSRESETRFFTTNLSGATAERLRITGAGNVGIGVTSPAYKLHVAGTSAVSSLDLNAVSTQLGISAVDVFVYDTSKDSDGGAWRKRTQRTSWYNETLNTATRGARREFPAVAVIVATTATITIYDGDSPDLPLWITYPANSFGWDNQLKKVNALNGIVAVANYASPGYSGNGLRLLNFVSDIFINDSAYITYTGQTGGRRVGLASTLDFRYQLDGIRPFSSALSNYEALWVEMTVLPNAPVDPATDLPTPTIAIATTTNVSVIRDDGTIQSLTWAGAALRLSGFNSDNAFCAIYNSGNTIYNVKYKPPYTTQDTSENYYYNLAVAQGPSLPWNPTNERSTWAREDEYIIGSIGVLRYLGKGIDGVPPTRTYSVQTTTYYTGWMVGDIKGAWLSDTTAETVTGAELITNGTFTTNTTGWTANTANGTGHTFSAVGGVMSVVRAVGKGIGFGEPYQVLTVEANKQYVVAVDVGTTAMSLSIASALASGTIYYNANLPVGRSVISFTPTVATVYFLFINDNAGTTSTVDNVSVRKAELDRSVNNNGLQVFGSIVKTPVATGADLVQYGGFSTANYLQQPYNSSLDFGTGNFCYMGWFKSNTATGANQPLFWRGQTDTNSYAMIEPYIRADGRVDVLTRNRAEAFTYFTSNTNILSQTWRFWCMVRRSGVMYWYIDGKTDGSAANTQDVTPLSTKGILEIGSDVSKAKSLPGNVALFRVSATSPSDAQIAKMYNDEKHLFQESAKATLYGASDNVTALAYDADTQLLHVGTSSGRSVFNGLRRVDNTATAVATSISASNGLVAEQ